MTREAATWKLASLGLEHEIDPVLVTAHTGRYLLDASSIFRGHVVRAAGGAFFFEEDGLDDHFIFDNSGDIRCFSSARLASPELNVA